MFVGSVGAASSGVFCRLRLCRSRKSAYLCPFPVKVLFIPLSFHISSSLFGRPRSRPLPQDQRSRQENIYTNRNVEFTVDLDDISTSAVDNIKRRFRTSEAKINRYCSAGTAAYIDLTTSFRIERGSRIVFSCRRSSLQFFANFFSWSLAIVLAFMFAMWAFRRRWGFGGWTVTRRDRSLGGKEVVVGRKNTVRKPERRGFKGSVNPLSTVAEEVKTNAILMRNHNNRQERLPKWWSDSISSPIILFAKEEGQREANKLVKGAGSSEPTLEQGEIQESVLADSLSQLAATLVWDNNLLRARERQLEAHIRSMETTQRELLAEKEKDFWIKIQEEHTMYNAFSDEHRAREAELLKRLEEAQAEANFHRGKSEALSAELGFLKASFSFSSSAPGTSVGADRRIELAAAATVLAADVDQSVAEINRVVMDANYHGAAILTSINQMQRIAAHIGKPPLHRADKRKAPADEASRESEQPKR